MILIIGEQLTEMQLENLTIRQASVNDIAVLWAIAEGMKSEKEVGYFDRSLEYQDAGARLVFIARLDGEDAGYVMLSWVPKYGFYQSIDCPEIQDLNVLPDFRGRGIGSAMIAHCESIARKNGKAHIGISFGLSSSYGVAQKLYFKLGYIPDGYGVTYDRKAVVHGELRPVDDDLCLMLIKKL